jgi:hypothetical protein
VGLVDHAILVGILWILYKKKTKIWEEETEEKEEREE